MNEKFFKKQKYYIDHRKIHADKTSSQREYIIKLFIFLILYLFYNANLLKTCKNIKLCFNVTDFVNDINILIYNKFIKRNCDILKKI